MGWIIGPKKLVKAACFFSQKLGIEQDYTLEIKKARMEDGLHGLCEMFDNNHFLITIEKSKKDRSEPIEMSLAHEMVHVKQFLDAEQNGYPEHYVEYLQSGLAGGDAYWEDPWEIEAFGRQVGLYVRWKKRKE